MTSDRWSLFRLVLRRTSGVLIGTVVLGLAACSGGGGDGDGAQASASASGGVGKGVDAASVRNDVYDFESDALAGNYLGMSNHISIGVLLPSGYDESGDRYPVVYFLPGFTSYENATTMPGEIGDASSAAGIILVTIIGANELGGGWYTNSDASGHWEQAIVDEIVPFVDANYRTVATRDGRGLAGHSMGGYGSFTIGMNNADVFGAVYVMAPAITGADGVEVPALFGSTGRASAVLEAMARLEGLDGPEVLDAMVSSPYSFEFSYGTAVAPDDEPPYFRYPYALVDGSVVRDDDVFAAWQAGLGNVDTEIAEHLDDLLSLTALGLDCGSNDELRWIWEGCGFLDESLTSAGVPHEYTVHDGTHTGRLPERLRHAMIPFFADAFAGVGVGLGVGE